MDMNVMNVIAVYDRSREHVLMCIRSKNPYKGKLNFVGGKVEPGENGVAAAYRELEEETSITHNDITLVHLMDMTYYTYRIQIQVYIGRLNKELTVAGDENQLIWMDADTDFENMSRFAGEGNIAHIIEMIRDDIDHLLPDNDTEENDYED